MINFVIEQSYNKIELKGLSVSQMRDVLDNLAPFIEKGSIRVVLKEAVRDEDSAER